MFILTTFIASKRFFWAFTTSQCISYHASQCPKFEKNIKYKTFSTLVLRMSLRISWCLLTLYFMPSTFNILVFTIVQKEKSNVKPYTLGVSSMPFQHPSYCLLPFCCSLSAFPSFCCFSSFVILGVINVCFCC
jgi:hypothetical protein